MIRRFNPYIAALLAAGSLAVAIPAVQAHPSDGPRAERMRGGEGGRFLRGLDLTEAQREQVKTIFEEQAPAMRSRMEAARTAQQELRALALSPSFDSGRARDLADTAATEKPSRSRYSRSMSLSSTSSSARSTRATAR